MAAKPKEGVGNPNSLALVHQGLFKVSLDLEKVPLVEESSSHKEANAGSIGGDGMLRHSVVAFFPAVHGLKDVVEAGHRVGHPQQGHDHLQHHEGLREQEHRRKPLGGGCDTRVVHDSCECLVHF